MSISTVVSLLTLLILLALYPHDPTSIPSNAELTRSLYVSRKSSSIFTAIAQSIALELRSSKKLPTITCSTDLKSDTNITPIVTWQESLTTFWKEIKRILLNHNWRMLASFQGFTGH